MVSQAEKHNLAHGMFSLSNTQTIHIIKALGLSLSIPLLSTSQKRLLPEATHVDTEASGVAHEQTPTPSPYIWLSQSRKTEKEGEKGVCAVCVCSGEVKLTSCENRHGWTLASTGPEGT